MLHVSACAADLEVFEVYDDKDGESAMTRPSYRVNLIPVLLYVTVISLIANRALLTDSVVGGAAARPGKLVLRRLRRLPVMLLLAGRFHHDLGD